MTCLPRTASSFTSQNRSTRLLGFKLRFFVAVLEHELTIPSRSRSTCAMPASPAAYGFPYRHLHAWPRVLLKNLKKLHDPQTCQACRPRLPTAIDHVSLEDCKLLQHIPPVPSTKLSRRSLQVYTVTSTSNRGIPSVSVRRYAA